MLPTARNEAEIERAISDVRKVLNAAENSNQAGEDLIVVMAKASALWEMLHLLCVEIYNGDLIDRLDYDENNLTAYHRAARLLGLNPETLEPA